MGGKDGPIESSSNTGGVQEFEVKVYGSGLRVWGSGLKVKGKGCRVQFLGFMVQGVSFRGWGYILGPGLRVYISILKVK